MKRLATIVGATLCAALGVGAFVLSSAENITAAKPQATTVKTTTAKDAATKIAGSIQVESLPPVPPTVKGSSATTKAYEVVKPFVGVSPRFVKSGGRLEVLVSGFAKNSRITIKAAGKTYKVTAYRNGNARIRFNAPKAAGTYTITATGFNTSGKSVRVTTTVKVISKK